jgi:pilus assembly protein CpaE
MDSVWVEAEGARYEFFPDIVQQSRPDVVIVALDSDPTKALQLITRLKQDYHDLPILAISGKADGQSILQALRAGVKEFLTQPVVLEELMATLQRVNPANQFNGAKKSSSMVISVLGSHGGIGCTSLATNLGCTLAQDKNNTVALLDLDLALGDADVLLDMISGNTLADVAMNIDRLDMQFLRRSLGKHSTGLALLPHPMQIEEMGVIHEDHLQRLIALLRASYSHLILDLSKGFTALDLTAIRLADVILMVCQLDLTSIRNAVRILHSLGDDNAMSEKVLPILNREGSDFGEGNIGIKKAEETIGKPFFWRIPNDYKAMSSSRAAGIPLVLNAPKSKVQQSIAKLAMMLCGQKVEEAVVGGTSWVGSDKY